MGTSTKRERIPDRALISRDPFPKSGKVYVKGALHDIRVAMREIELEDSFPAAGAGKKPHERKASITVYDTSGPYTDPDADIDVHRGLSPLREKWVLGRGDVETLPDFSSKFARGASGGAKILGIKFKNARKPLRAKAGANVTQMHYARKGIIT
ncbi:MAG: phosphomethylpyrimidine synthase ThiC, partial [Thermodesulfobacteriota bacterium]